MNAIQFIQQHGVEKAREVVEGAPEKDYFLCFCEKCGWGGSSEKLNVDSYDSAWISCPDCHSEHIQDDDVVLADLKRLVESINLVESWGGIEDIKLYDLEPCKKKPESAGFRLIQAIADYEAIFGGEHV